MSVEIIDSRCAKNLLEIGARKSFESYTFLNSSHFGIDIVSLSAYPNESNGWWFGKFTGSNNGAEESSVTNNILIRYVPLVIGDKRVSLTLDDSKSPVLRVDDYRLTRLNFHRYAPTLLYIFQIISGGSREFKRKYRSCSPRISNINLDNIISHLGNVVAPYATRFARNGH